MIFALLSLLFIAFIVYACVRSPRIDVIRHKRGLNGKYYREDSDE